MSEVSSKGPKQQVSCHASLVLSFASGLAHWDAPGALSAKSSVSQRSLGVSAGKKCTESQGQGLRFADINMFVLWDIDMLECVVVICYDVFWFW